MTNSQESVFSKEKYDKSDIFSTRIHDHDRFHDRSWIRASVLTTEKDHRHFFIRSECKILLFEHTYYLNRFYHS